VDESEFAAVNSYGAYLLGHPLLLGPRLERLVRRHRHSLDDPLRVSGILSP